MKGIVLPDRTEDFTADPVELFFDLAFVFAFSQLVSHIVHHPTWTGLGETTLIFMLVWFPWSQFTWSANAVSGNGRAVRLVFLVATVASIPMGAAVTTAFGEGDTVFAVSASIILMMGLATMGAAFEPSSPQFQAAVRYAWPNVVAVVLLIGGSFLADEVRVIVWLVALAIMIAGTIAAGNEEWIIRSGHFAERHALIIIVALGEVIVAIGIAVVDSLQEGEGFPASTMWALIGSGAFAALLWWGYFDRAGPAFEHRAEGLDGVAAGRFARDVYTYTHAPVVFGVILSAAALEEIALHPKDPLPDAFRLLVVGGLLLYLGGVAIGVYRAYRVIIPERLGCAAALIVLVAISSSWDAVALLLTIDALLLATLIAEHLRVERMMRAEATSASAP